MAKVYEAHIQMNMRTFYIFAYITNMLVYVCVFGLDHPAEFMRGHMPGRHCCCCYAIAGVVNDQCRFVGQLRRRLATAITDPRIVAQLQGSNIHI